MLGLKIQSELNDTRHRLERQGVASFDGVPSTWLRRDEANGP